MFGVIAAELFGQWRFFFSSGDDCHLLFASIGLLVPSSWSKRLGEDGFLVTGCWSFTYIQGEGRRRISVLLVRGLYTQPRRG
jgi:hypothetical protein